VPTERALERHLVRTGLIDEERLTRARSEAEKADQRLPDILVQLGFVTEEQIYRSLAEFCEMRFVQPSRIEIGEEVVKTVPARFATHYRFVPIEERNGTLVIATDDPLNHQLLDDIRTVLKRRIDPTVTGPTEIGKAIKTLYGVGADTMERMISESGDEGVLNLDSAMAGANLGDEKIDASIIKFTNEVFSEAIKAGATDVHIEPFEEYLRVRFRIDGILHQVPVPPSVRGYQPAIVSRVKIMANLNIAEKRLPQDGKILASLADDQFDLRVSILPTPHGETVNIRILNRSSMFLSLEQLGFRDRDLDQFNRFITRPHGIILVTGPTGSGKTTTLYAALAKLNSLEHKIITIEDPIEYQLTGITQMQVMDQIGFNFSRALRSMLRHDPDIMLVGEIRDYETAEMAVRSSLTGHLVFSTLHTNDAAGAVTRLTDMGVEPFLISSTTIASIAQRLVRVLCPECGQTYEPDADAFRELGFKAEDAPPDTVYRKAVGCDACRFTGYRGRRAIYEIMPFTNIIRHMTVERRTATDIKRKACETGMRTLRESGWARICEGATTFEEVMRVTVDSDLDLVEEQDNAPVPV
jgi:type II secretory ATPase GspE/PulE/Tfp pilus assembly ATPase PilB-like protein